MKIAVILSGCGYLDGAEIRESVLALLYLDQQGAEVSMFAPDKAQMHVVNHISGEAVADEQRNVLAESARIARGNVLPLAQLSADDFDALVIPGGFGVAKNLSDFALKGADMQADSDFATTVNAFYAAGKPIGAICIAPAVISGVLKEATIHVTIGDDADCAGAIIAMGGRHSEAETQQIIVDSTNKIVSCSAYMREDAIADVAKGIEKVIITLSDMVRNK